MSTRSTTRFSDDAPDPIPFPRDAQEGINRQKFSAQVLKEFETMSRRIDDLARELNCLGYFDEDDRPRAA